MTAIEILRAASRSVPNEDYVQFMAAVDAVAEVIEVLRMVDGIWSGDQTANIDPDSPLAKVRGALSKVGAR